MNILKRGQENIHYYINSVKKESYITADNIKKLLRGKGIEPRSVDIREQLIECLRKNIVNIVDLENYEYDKPYKYFNAYDVVGDNALLNVNEVKKNLSVNQEKTGDFLSLDFQMPTIKEFEDGFDLKFSKIIPVNESGLSDYLYPVVVSYINDLKIIVIKYGTITEEQLDLDNEKYFEIIKEVISWMHRKLGIELSERNLMASFRALRSDIKNNPTEHLNEKNVHVNLLDDQLGRTSFTATEKDDMRFLDGLVAMIKEITDEQAKLKLLKYIDDYELNSEMLEIKIKFGSCFSNRKRPDKVLVGARKIFTRLQGNNIRYLYTRCHVYAGNHYIDRERINYVIKYLSEYPKKIESVSETA